MRHTRRHQRLVVKLLIRPAPPTGPGPVTASGHVAPRHQASHSEGRTRGHQPTAQHHQATKAILTVTRREPAPRVAVNRPPLQPTIRVVNRPGMSGDLLV